MSFKTRHFLVFEADGHIDPISVVTTLVAHASSVNVFRYCWIFAVIADVLSGNHYHGNINNLPSVCQRGTHLQSPSFSQYFYPCYI